MTLTKKDVRKFLSEYKIVALLIVIAIIWAFFGYLTYDSDLGGSQFLTPRNFSNLLRQMAITGMLASAMVFVIVAGEIDLSVGSLLGLLGGIGVSAGLQAFISTVGGPGSEDAPIRLPISWVTIVAGFGVWGLLGRLVLAGH